MTTPNDKDRALVVELSYLCGIHAGKTTADLEEYQAHAVAEFREEIEAGVRKELAND